MRHFPIKFADEDADDCGSHRLDASTLWSDGFCLRQNHSKCASAKSERTNCLYSWKGAHNKRACETASQARYVVEMGGSRTPRPNVPTGECTTGIVDVFTFRPGLPPTGSLDAGPLVLDGD